MIYFSNEQPLEGIRSALGKIKGIFSSTLLSEGPTEPRWDLMAPSFATEANSSRNEQEQKTWSQKVPLVPPGVVPFPMCLLPSSSTDLVTVALPGLHGDKEQQSAIPQKDKGKKFLHCSCLTPSHAGSPGPGCSLRAFQEPAVC